MSDSRDGRSGTAARSVMSPYVRVRIERPRWQAWMACEGNCGAHEGLHSAGLADDPKHAVRVTLRLVNPAETHTSMHVARASEIRNGLAVEAAIVEARPYGGIGAYEVVEEKIVAHLMVSPPSVPRRRVHFDTPPLPWEENEAEGRGSRREDVFTGRIIL